MVSVWDGEWESRACGNNQAHFRSLITWEGWFCLSSLYLHGFQCVRDNLPLFQMDGHWLWRVLWCWFFFFHKSGLGDYHILSKIVSSLLLYSVYWSNYFSSQESGLSASFYLAFQRHWNVTSYQSHMVGQFVLLSVLTLRFHFYFSSIVFAIMEKLVIDGAARQESCTSVESELLGAWHVPGKSH